MTELKGTQTSAAEELSEPMTIGVDAYISEDYARAERDRLWRKVWQQVGRVEEIPEVGNYLTYDILDDSILVGHSDGGSIALCYLASGFFARGAIVAAPHSFNEEVTRRAIEGQRANWVAGPLRSRLH